MRILHVNNIYGYGYGTETYLMNLCDEMEQLGHEVAIVCSEEKIAKDTFIRERPVYCLPNLNNMKLKGNNATSELIKIVENINPDIIQVHNIKNPFLLKTLNDLRPTLKFIHTYYPICLGAKYHRWWNKVCHQKLSLLCPIFGCISHCCSIRIHLSFMNLRIKMHELKALKHLNKLLVASIYVKNVLVQNGVCPDKIEVMPHYVELPDVETISMNNGKNIILFIGRLTFDKGVKYLIKSLVNIKLPYKLFIIGDGKEFPFLKSLAEKLGLSNKVEFKGWVPPNRLKSYFKKAAFLVMTSVWPEPFGFVGIEAMSYGKPVIAFDVGAIPEWLRDGQNGFLIKRGDILGLSDSINKLLSNKNMAIKMGINARNMIKKNFSKKSHINKLFAIYRKLLH